MLCRSARALGEGDRVSTTVPDAKAAVRVSIRYSERPAAAFNLNVRPIGSDSNQQAYSKPGAAQFERGGFRAQGVGLALQLLDQEVQALADFAAGVEQAADLVEVGAQAREFLGDVDAQRVGRSRGQDSSSGSMPWPAFHQGLSRASRRWTS